MEAQRRHQRKGQKRRIEDAAAAPSDSSAANEDDEEGGGEEICCRRSEKALIAQVRDQVEVLDHLFSWRESDRTAAKRATHILAELAKSEDSVNVIVDGGAVPLLVKHLREPEPLLIEGNACRPFEHDVEKGSAFALSLLAVKPEHQQLIVDAGALPLLVDLLKRHRRGCSSRAVNSVIRRAADAITNLAHENSSIKTCVRLEGGIPPLVELLEFKDLKVQRAAAGALRTLAFKNDENNNQIVDCGALPTLILMLRSEDAAIHYEAVRRQNAPPSPGPQFSAASRWVAGTIPSLFYNVDGEPMVSPNFNELPTISQISAMMDVVSTTSNRVSAAVEFLANLVRNLKDVEDRSGEVAELRKFVSTQSASITFLQTQIQQLECREGIQAKALESERKQRVDAEAQLQEVKRDLAHCFKEGKIVQKQRDEIMTDFEKLKIQAQEQGVILEEDWSDDDDEEGGADPAEVQEEPASTKVTQAESQAVDTPPP